ncbi:MAG: 4Fe-4S ferredoxin [Desulfobacterales bacterium]|nr:4Fe-4S ferredoxin [Desulfobacterales bacterium]MCP4162569.1 4Fe-4S ferredoxin [Deltaproteobacteria bacterium]
MKVIKIDKAKWASGVSSLQGTYKIIGPAVDGDAHNFKELAKGEEPDFNFLNTKLSPKSIVFPQSEKMLEYSVDENKEDHHIMKEVKKDYSPRAVVGIRPCDAKAINLVKMNFDTDDYKDPYWLKLYEATTFVGLACDKPCDSCFCTSTGCGPYNEEGLDILLKEDGASYVAKALTEKGETLLGAAGFSDAGDEAAFEAGKKDAEAKITSSVQTDKLKDFSTLDLYNADFWEDLSFACLNCGTCTFACPTCWCFDIQDEVKGKDGVRVRNWDSCMFPLFTMHTTGHNPRGTKEHRVRQRFMHKLKYFVDKYEKGIMCVGCGRCVNQCPVNIDIRKVCDVMNNHVPEPVK